MLSQEFKASTAAALSGFLYGFLGFFGMTVIKAGFSVPNMLFWRFLISAIVSMVFVLPKIKQLEDNWKSLLFSFATGAVFYSCSTNLYFYSSLYIGTGLAMVIYFTFPAMVMLCNRFFFGEQIARSDYVAMLIIFFGLLLFIDLDELQMDAIGVALGIVCALFYAAYIITSKRFKVSAPMSTVMVSLGCAFSSLIFTCLDHSFALPNSWALWQNLLGIGLVSTAIPILLFLYSLRSISSEKASILAVLEPVFVVICGVLLLNEEMTLAHFIGILVVLSGAFLTLFGSSIRAYFGFNRQQTE